MIHVAIFRRASVRVGEGVPVDVLDLEHAVERLADGVVETRADASHGLRHAQAAAGPLKRRD